MEHLIVKTVGIVISLIPFTTAGLVWRRDYLIDKEREAARKIEDEAIEYWAKRAREKYPRSYMQKDGPKDYRIRVAGYSSQPDRDVTPHLPSASAAWRAAGSIDNSDLRELLQKATASAEAG